MPTLERIRGAGCSAAWGDPFEAWKRYKVDNGLLRDSKSPASRRASDEHLRSPATKVEKLKLLPNYQLCDFSYQGKIDFKISNIQMRHLIFFHFTLSMSRGLTIF